MRCAIFLISLPLVAAMSSAAVAQSSSPRAAAAATQAAKSVTSSVRPTPNADPPATTDRRDLTLTGPATRRPIVTVPAGGECTAAYAAANDVARVQINPAGSLAPNSSTIIQLPIEPVRNGYLADVRAATLHSTIPESCARLNH